MKLDELLLIVYNLENQRLEELKKLTGKRWTAFEFVAAVNSHKQHYNMGCNGHV